MKYDIAVGRTPYWYAAILNLCSFVFESAIVKRHKTYMKPENSIIDIIRQRQSKRKYENKDLSPDDVASVKQILQK